MGINFSSMNSGVSAPTPAPVAPAGMTLDLSKNMVLDVTKRNPGLRNLVLAAGWDVSQSNTAIDLDIMVFCTVNGKLRSVSDVVFFNNKVVPGVKLNGDNVTGQGEGDDETIDIDLASIDSAINEIYVAVAIYDAVNRRQTFGVVNNSYVRLLDKNAGDRELCHFILKDDYSTYTSVVFAKLVRNGSDWDFVTLGEGHQADINGLVNLFA